MQVTIYRSNRFLSKVQKLSLMVIADNKKRCTNKVSGTFSTRLKVEEKNGTRYSMALSDKNR